MDSIKLVKNTREETAVIEAHIREVAGNTGELKILEAGCGQKWPVSHSNPAD